METISSSGIMVYDTDHDDIVNSSSESVPTPDYVLSNRDGHPVNSYVELLTKVASLNYYNPRFQLLFRGQSQDFKMGEKISTSNLYPSILRGFSPRSQKRREALDNEFKLLIEAERLLIEHIKHRDLAANQVVRWAILQHYEVCKTPLLDVTASLQSALAFAVGERNSGWLYVLGFPPLTGGVSVSIEAKTQVINLCQICPPEALRLHFQEGLLVSDYPEVRSREQSHGQQGMRGNNFAARLLTKFKLQNCLEWQSEGFLKTRNSLLFPNHIDPWYERTQLVREKLHA